MPYRALSRSAGRGVGDLSGKLPRAFNHARWRD
jgi:hypothetical protein